MGSGIKSVLDCAKMVINRYHEDPYTEQDGFLHYNQFSLTVCVSCSCSSPDFLSVSTSTKVQGQVTVWSLEITRVR